jgi:hypothetical protein
VLEGWSAGVAQDIAFMLETLRQQMKSIVQNAHNDSLHREGATEKHEERMHHLDWCVMHVQDELILGDFLLLVKVGSSLEYTIYVMASEFPNTIYLPIASNRLLVGYEPGNKSEVVDAININKEIARNSMEYFISASESPYFNELARSIGAALEGLKSFFAQMMDDLIKTKMLGTPPK